VRDTVKFVAIANTVDSMHRASVSYTVGSEVPCIEESVWANEFYQASAQGYRPEVRIKTNKRNYNGEPRMQYNGTTYTVIRTEKAEKDWLIVIGQSLVNEVARDV
jgi:hypothetical protein